MVAFILIVAFFLACYAILRIHRIGISRALRMIGHVFIGAGDAVDFWKARTSDLNMQERQQRNYAA